MLANNHTRRAAGIAMLVGMLISHAAWADVTVTGGVEPLDLTGAVTSSVRIGYGGPGSVTVDNGSVVDLTASSVFPISAYVGYWDEGTLTLADTGTQWIGDGYMTVGESGTLSVLAGAQGSSGPLNLSGSAANPAAMTVDGAGSRWACSQWMYVGRGGVGTLNITHGGVVEAGMWVHVAALPGSDGEIHFDSGTLNAQSLMATRANLTGAGTINTNGYISEGDLLLDSPASLIRTIVLQDAPGQNVTINLDLNGSGDLGVGSSAHVTINNGMTVNAQQSFIGAYEGTGAMMTVDGLGTTWTCDDRIYIGDYGEGTLTVSHGATVNCEYMKINATRAGSGIHLDGGTINTGVGFEGSLDQLTGSGTINTIGIFSDVDLVFDSPGGQNQTLIVDTSPGEQVHINLSVTDRAQMGVGYTGSGTIAVRNGVALESSVLVLGEYAGSHGVATVEGDGTFWDAGPFVNIGRSGQGELVVRDGATFIAGSLDGGSLGQGEVTVRDGAALIASGLVAGSSDGGEGSVLVDGPATRLTIEDALWFEVGRYGHGQVTVRNGGTLTSSGRFHSLGGSKDGTGIVTIDGPGSSWAAGTSSYDDTDVTLGDWGEGTLNVTNRGRFELYGELAVGGRGTGTLNVLSGGEVSVNGDLAAGQWYDSTGTIDVSGHGSVLRVTGNLGIAGLTGTGRLDITDGALVVAGTYSWGLTIRGSEATINMATGGMLALTGYHQALPDSFDDFLQDWVSGHAGDDAFHYWDASLGDWAPLADATLGVDYRFQFIDLPTKPDGSVTDRYLLLTVGGPEIVGDLTGDGVVDESDFAILAYHFGSTNATWLQGDLTGDSVVDDSDFALLAAHYGQSASVPVSAIPEPACLVVLMGLVVARRGRRT